MIMCPPEVPGAEVEAALNCRAMFVLCLPENFWPKYPVSQNLCSVVVDGKVNHGPRKQ